MLEERLGYRVFIENDSRAMTYGEYMYGVGNGEQNMLFLNLSWGFGIGMILGGELHSPIWWHVQPTQETFLMTADAKGQTVQLCLTYDEFEKLWSIRRMTAE